MDKRLVESMNKKKPRTFEEIEEIWYEGYYSNRRRHYHESRYHFLNLHSFFNGVGTVELRAVQTPNFGHYAAITSGFKSFLMIALWYSLGGLSLRLP
jgi:hypothetical protein